MNLYDFSDNSKFALFSVGNVKEKAQKVFKLSEKSYPNFDAHVTSQMPAAANASNLLQHVFTF